MASNHPTAPTPEPGGDHDALALALDALIESAARDYQMLQLAAQHADIEGHALPAGILRSLSESHTGTAHALLGIKAALAPAPAGGTGRTARNVADAIARTGRSDALAAALLAAIPTSEPPHLRDDIEATLRLTATNRTRLEALARSLAAPPADSVA